MSTLNELRYRDDDQYFPIPEHEKHIPTVWAEKFMDIPANPDGLNILEGMCFDRNGDLFFCNTPQCRIYKVDMGTKEISVFIDLLVETKKLSVFIDLPEHMMPSAVKIHKDGRLFVTMAGSDEGSLVAIISPEGKILDKILTGTGRMIDDMVFDQDGGFYCTDLGGDFNHKTAGILYVEPDYKTVHSVVQDGMIATNGISLDPDGKHLWVTEYGGGRLLRFTLGKNKYSIDIASSYVPYTFTGLEGPDSTIIDEDGNLYVAICGQGRFMVFSRNGFPIGQILIPGRECGEMCKSTHLAIRPGTNEAYMCTADLNRNLCAIYRAKVFARACRSYQFQ